MLSTTKKGRDARELGQISCALCFFLSMTKVSTCTTIRPYLNYHHYRLLGEEKKEQSTKHTTPRRHTTPKERERERRLQTLNSHLPLSLSIVWQFVVVCTTHSHTLVHTHTHWILVAPCVSVWRENKERKMGSQKICCCLSVSTVCDDGWWMFFIGKCGRQTTTTTASQSLFFSLEALSVTLAMRFKLTVSLSFSLYALFDTHCGVPCLATQARLLRQKKTVNCQTPSTHYQSPLAWKYLQINNKCYFYMPNYVIYPNLVIIQIFWNGY